MEFGKFDEVWQLGEGATAEEMAYLRTRMDYAFPEDFEQFYLQHNGAIGALNGIAIEFWDLEQIISFNEIYEDAINGEFVFFASSDEGYDGYAYQKVSNHIFVFPIDCGVDDISSGKHCANNLCELFSYWEKENNN